MIRLLASASASLSLANVDEKQNIENKAIKIFIKCPIKISRVLNIYLSSTFLFCSEMLICME